MLHTLCALLILSLGLGHQPVQAAVPLEAFSEQYRLPDGTFADICAVGHDDHDHGVHPTCEVCRLAASVALPTPAGDVGLPLDRAFLNNPLRIASLTLGFTALARPMSRGPPQTT
ncbi:hypothetical protein [Rhizobium halophilum]|uniref:hypothetical protein n=1 Tax=Rhizobium halophilum TaxID=2846852 RepID=UPI001EFD78C8|nr:hypothetical protein [Rhizobium halophilum]MCF6368654.1 hypothetical protein [Rhizobium halophilum]